MAMQADPQMIRSLPAGQRLQCETCKAEVEIVQPCSCDPPDMILSCCGRAMTPTTGQDVHVGVE